MANNNERAELHKTIWRIANDLRGSVDGWDFKSYVLGMLFYRFISENLTSYLNEQERKAGTPDFDYTRLSDADAEFGRAETVKEKGFYILPSELFAKVRARARHDANLNETLSRIFADIEGSANLFESQQVRAEWDADSEKWWFSVLDVIAILTDQPDYKKVRNYWKWLKNKLIAEGSQLVSATNQLKLTAADGKKYLTDVADTEQILRLVQSIPSKKAERITQIVGYIREHFDQKTKRSASASYLHSVVANVAEVITSKNRIEEIRRKQRLNGFNSIFAAASIEAAKSYYAEFAEQQKALTPAQRLKVGLIYSFAANEEESDGLLGEEAFETEGLDQGSRDFLDAAIKDYNVLFGTSYDTSAEKFQNYYKDLSQRLKNRELDIVIVVNMFLTGFDATTLNTLWADKNLRAHGLIQAYSRTNHILNSVKTYGNIVSFRDLEQETNDALALFGNKDAKGIVLLKPYAEYYKEYQKRIEELVANFPLDKAIIGEATQKAFIKLFGAILRLKNILTAFDDFAGNEILSERDFQDYQSLYLNLYAEFRSTSDADKESINDDVVFEIELIKQVEINVDYILMLVERYLKAKGSGQDKEIRATIERAINASPSLRNKKDLIEQFVDSVSTKAKVDAQWQAFVAKRKVEDLDRIIADEGLNADETKAFVDNAFRDGAIPVTGTAITKILPPVSRFAKNNNHSAKKQTVLDKLAAFFERYFGLA